MVNFLKRFAVLIPGLVVSYFAARELYPAIDKRIPASLAIFVTYAVTAYVLIPAALRFVHAFMTFKHLPVYSTTPDGFASDPINIGLVGSEKQVISAMNKAGWFVADRRSPLNLFRMGIGLAFNLPYHHAPFSTLYLFGRKQDLGFQLPIGNSPRKRHHVRFWAADFTYDPDYQEDILFWQKHTPKSKPTQALWVGAASLDEGLGLIRHNAQITHKIKPDTNAERQLIVDNLKEKGLAKRTKTARLGKAYSLRNRVWRGQLKSDGKIVIVELK